MEDKRKAKRSGLGENEKYQKVIKRKVRYRKERKGNKKTSRHGN